MGTMSPYKPDVAAYKIIEERSPVSIDPAKCFRWKERIDPFLAALLLIPGLPVIFALILIVRLTSKGPGLFCQVRVGKDGQLFTMYKLRTMRCDAEAKTGAIWAQSNDPRVTLLGRVLRKLHLDEIPQLFNVLKGEMALIGPRPERPEFVEILKEQVPDYMSRLAVRPGVTGLAQINLPPDSDLVSVWRKLQLDLEYIQRATICLDLRMFFCTAVRLLGLPGDLVMRLFCVMRSTPEPSPEVAERLVGSGDNLFSSTPQTVNAVEPSAQRAEADKRTPKANARRRKDAAADGRAQHKVQCAPTNPR